VGRQSDGSSFSRGFAVAHAFVAPTEVRCEFLKSSFFVVAVILCSNRVIIRIKMHREATRNPHMAPWGWMKDEKNNFFYFPNILRKKYFYFSTLLNSNKKLFV
jgi:hypothetical protein